MSDHDDATVEPDGTARPNDDGSLSAVQEFGILLGILVWAQLVRLARDDS